MSKRLKVHAYPVCGKKVVGVMTGKIENIECLHCIRRLERIAVSPVALKQLHERRLGIWYQRRNPMLMKAIATMQKNGVLRAA